MSTLVVIGYDDQFKAEEVRLALAEWRVWVCVVWRSCDGRTDDSLRICGCGAVDLDVDGCYSAAGALR